MRNINVLSQTENNFLAEPGVEIKSGKSSAPPFLHLTTFSHAEKKIPLKGICGISSIALYSSASNLNKKALAEKSY